MVDSSYPIVAVDGTAASGKSTFSRALATRLRFYLRQHRRMYRGVTWYLLQKQLDLHDATAVARAVASVRVSPPASKTTSWFFRSPDSTRCRMSAKARSTKAFHSSPKFPKCEKSSLPSNRASLHRPRSSWRAATSAPSSSRARPTNFTSTQPRGSRPAPQPAGRSRRHPEA